MAKQPEDGAQLLADIVRAAERTAEADRELHEAVQAARDAGYSWTEIGDVLGVKRQSAWQRFSGVQGRY